tara:strand:- start:247 stop:546 length:300 start_codon:yes stop_codon:yes gene_type:complete
MTKDDIRKLAREAGLAAVLGEHASEYGNGTFENTPYPELERFANLVAAAEREACAKVAMAIAEQGLPEEMPEGEELLRACEQIAGGVLIADAIRARGTT